MILAKYGHSGRADFLSTLFGDLRMSELTHHTGIAVLQMTEGKPVPRLVTNFRKPKNEADDAPWKNDETMPNPEECLVRDVLIQTAAAPTFFPSYQGHVDGEQLHKGRPLLPQNHINLSNPSPCHV
jgi:patatin-like phospholipase/acyl hydrolase